jgi:hypothetical protein
MLKPKEKVSPRHTERSPERNAVKSKGVVEVREQCRALLIGLGV